VTSRVGDAVNACRILVGICLGKRKAGRQRKEGDGRAVLRWFLGRYVLRMGGG